jgi:hypothetical protein
LRKKPITILLLFILLLPLLFGERSFLSIASYLRIGSKERFGGYLKRYNTIVASLCSKVKFQL